MQINKTINASVNIVYYIARVDLNVDMACVCARRMKTWGKYIESEDFVGPVKKKKKRSDGDIPYIPELVTFHCLFW